jgi:transcriptional regulator with XRE-family HTH domain|tara:strand:- start:255 stop:467 length:213 start_codon:yes stop_codon:yes gene_type:complete
MNIQSLIGINVRKYRLEKGLSQNDLAFQSELDRSYISDIELGKSNPTILTLQKISRALELEIYLFFEIKV